MLLRAAVSSLRSVRQAQDRQVATRTHTRDACAGLLLGLDDPEGEGADLSVLVTLGPEDGLDVFLNVLGGVHKACVGSV